MTSTDFPILVTIDPAEAKKGSQQVIRELDRMEREALELRKAIREALAVRDAGTAASLGRVEQVLLRTEKRAQQTNLFIEQIGKDVQAQGLRRVGDELDRTKKKATELGTIVRRVFAGVSAAVAVRQFVGLSDEFTRVQNQLRTVIEDQGELNETFGALQRIAGNTRTELGGVVQLFQRGSIAAQELGASNEEMLRFVDRVGKALAVQGQSSQQASGALLQLSQALGSGIVRAEEFNSILEGAFPIAQAAARGIDEAGGSVSRLRALIVTGQITSREFFEGFLRGSNQIEAQFAKTSPTIGQSLVVLRNELVASVGAFNEATHASELLAGGVLLIADNLPVVTTAVGALATVLTVRLAAQALPAATAGMKAFVLSSGPLLAVVTILGSAASILSSITEEYEQAAATLRQSEEDAKFVPALASQLTAAQREINNLNRLVSTGAQDRLSESQQARVVELQQRIESLRQTIRGNREDQVAAAEAQRENAEATERQAKLLEEITGPLEKYRTLQSDLALLLQQGAINQEQYNAALSKGRPEGFVDELSKQEEALKRQQQLLEKIRGPIERYGQTVNDLRVLLAQGKIDQEEFNRALQEAKPRTTEKAEDPFAAQLESLKKQNEELRIRQQFFGPQREGLLIELELAAKGVVITDEKREALARELTLRAQLNDQIKQQTAEEEKQAQVAKENQERIARLREQVDVLGQLRQQEQDLLALREQEHELVPQIDKALEDLRLRQLEASNQLGDGFERALIKIKREAEDLAAVGEQVVTLFADRATDAIVEFVQTGQFNFRQFATSILEDLTRIIVRLLVVQAISAVAFGGASGTAGLGGLALNAGRQHGGTVQPGQRPFPVGEGGPEVFVPNRTGTIVPNPRDVQQAPPQVNLQAVVVQSEELVPGKIASGDVDDVLIVRVGENKEKFRRALGIS